MAELINSCTERESLGGGVYRQVHYVKPVAYRRENVLKRITNKLDNTGDSVLTIGVDELAQFRIRNRLAGESPTVHFGKGNSHIKIHPLNTNNVLGQPVGENGFIYPNAWNGADLEFVIGGHILRKNIYLKAGHPSQFAFEINDHIGLDFDTLQTEDFRILQPSLSNPNEAESDIGLEWAKSVQGNKLTLIANLPAGNYSGWILDPTLVLQPDAAAGVDTRVVSAGSADNNYGVNERLAIGEVSGGDQSFRTLIKFDLITMPNNSIISSTTLSLYCILDYSSNTRDQKVFRQKRAWVEGTGDGVDSGDGATWNEYDRAGSLSWQPAGGFGANDCEQTEIATRNFTANEALNEFKDFSLTPTTKAGLDLGEGWMIKADTELDDLYQFASSDIAIAANRPKLVVVYTLGGDAPFSRIFAPGFRGAFG